MMLLLKHSPKFVFEQEQTFEVKDLLTYSRKKKKVICSRGQPTRGFTTAWVLNGGLATFHCNVTECYTGTRKCY
jgi:hypothetical protein